MLPDLNLCKRAVARQMPLQLRTRRRAFGSLVQNALSQRLVAVRVWVCHLRRQVAARESLRGHRVKLGPVHDQIGAKLSLERREICPSHMRCVKPKGQVLGHNTGTFSAQKLSREVSGRSVAQKSGSHVLLNNASQKCCSEVSLRSVDQKCRLKCRSKVSL